MKYIAAVFAVILVAVVSADTGEFVPKAFYTIDSNGVQSPLSLINPIGQSVLLSRLRRQLPPVFSSSSSSSSSSSTSSNGGPVFFQHTSTNHHIPPNVGNLADRFGGDDAGTGSATGAGTNTYGTGNIPFGLGFGTYTQSSGVIFPNGQISDYQTNTGKF